MLIVVKHLTSRNGHLQYRRAIPNDVRDSFGGKREWTKSLKDYSKTNAAMIVSDLDAKYDKLIASIRRGNTLVAEKLAVEQFIAANPRATEDTLLDPAVPEAGTGRDNAVSDLMEPSQRHTYVGGELRSYYLEPDDKTVAIINALSNHGVYVPDSKLDSVYQYYLDNRPPQDTKIVEYAYRAFYKYKGNVDLRTIKRRQVKEFIQRQLKTKSPETVRRQLVPLSAMVNLYIEDFEISDWNNPFANHKLPKTNEKTKRLAFHKTHLDLIRNYLKNSKASKETTTIVKIMMFTGAGPKEIIGLQQRDVDLTTGIPFVYFRENTTRDLKTGDIRERRIPIAHTDLLESLRAFKRENSNKPLFSKGSTNPDSVSAKINKFIRAAGVTKSRKLVAYSFRHTFKQALSDCNVDRDRLQYLMGHARDRADTSGYGNPTPPLELLAKDLKKAIPKLGHTDPIDYDEGLIPDLETTAPNAHMKNSE